MWLVDAPRRLITWLTEVPGESYDSPWLVDDDLPDAASDDLECPWRHSWDFLPKRSAGPAFTKRDYAAARERAEEVARMTLGDDLWSQAQRDGHIDLPSQRYRGVIYRLRIGRRIEVLCEPGIRPPWPHPFLCINPRYPLPEAEFFAHLYLYVRDHEDEVIRVAAPQPWDQVLGRTF